MKGNNGAACSEHYCAAKPTLKRGCHMMKMTGLLTTLKTLEQRRLQSHTGEVNSPYQRDVSTMTDGNQLAATSVSSQPTKEASSVPVTFDRGTGPVLRQPYFGGYATISSESNLMDFTGVTFKIFAVLLSILPQPAR